MRLPPEHGQAPVGLALDEDGHGEHATVPFALDEEARVRGQRDRGVVEDIRGPDGAALADGATGGAFAQSHAQAAEEIARHAGGPRIGLQPGLRVEAEDSRRARPRETLAPLHDRVEDLVELERGGESAADLEQRPIARSVLLGLGEELSVVDRNGRVTGE